MNDVHDYWHHLKECIAIGLVLIIELAILASYLASYLDGWLFNVTSP